MSSVFGINYGGKHIRAGGSNGLRCALPSEQLDSERAQEIEHLRFLLPRVAEADKDAFLRVLRNPGLSEETTQDVFLQIWRTGVPTIACARNSRERTAKRFTARAPRAPRTTKCLDTLTETQRESVQLAYYQGLTYREVANGLGVSRDE